MAEYVNIGDAGAARKEKTFLEEFMPSSFGKTEHSILREVEQRYGFTWDRMHAYKTIIEFPTLPDTMPAAHILEARIPRCKLSYEVLDRCMVVETARETRKEPFARMYVCKEFFTAFDRCTRRRDMRIMERILKWEGKHFSSLTDQDREDYGKDLGVKYDYCKYAVDHEPTPALKEKAQRDACHLEFRMKNLDTLEDEKAQKKLRWRLGHYIHRGGGRGSSWNRRMWDAHRVEWNKESATFSDPIWRPTSEEQQHAAREKAARGEDTIGREFMNRSASSAAPGGAAMKGGAGATRSSEMSSGIAGG